MAGDKSFRTLIINATLEILWDWTVSKVFTYVEQMAIWVQYDLEGMFQFLWFWWSLLHYGHNVTFRDVNRTKKLSLETLNVGNILLLNLIDRLRNTKFNFPYSKKNYVFPSSCVIVFLFRCWMQIHQYGLREFNFSL